MKLLKAAKFAVLLLTSPFKLLHFSLSLLVDASISAQFGVSISTDVMSGKVFFYSWGVLIVLVPLFTKTESRSCLVFLLIKMQLTAGFEMTSLNSIYQKFVGFLVIYSIIEIVSGHLDVFPIDLIMSKTMSRLLFCQQLHPSY